MKKELLAGITFLLLIIGAATNIHYLKGLTDELNVQLDEVTQLCANEEYDKAQTKLQKTLDAWIAANNYTYVFIRHSEVDATTDAFYDGLIAIANENTTEIQHSIAMLKKHINNIFDMECVTIRSVF